MKKYFTWVGVSIIVIFIIFAIIGNIDEGSENEIQLTDTDQGEVIVKKV